MLLALSIFCFTALNDTGYLCKTFKNLLHTLEMTLKLMWILVFHPRWFEISFVAVKQAFTCPFNRQPDLFCAQDEGYPPPAEMPIKKLEFTPFKPPPAAKVSDASSKDSAEDIESAELEGAVANAEVIA